VKQEVSQEVLKQIKLIELKSRKLVNTLFGGEYKTSFKGQGMTFSEFREYVPGDDVRHISWTLTARTGRPHIKKFDEEREMNVLILVDVSGSSYFGSRYYLKLEAMAQIAALLGLAATKNRDVVGFGFYSEIIEKFTPFSKSRTQVQRMIRDVLTLKAQSRKTNLKAATDFARSVCKKRSTIFLIGDLFGVEHETSLRLLSRKHDVIGVAVNDPLELEPPSLGLIQWVDPESGESQWVDTDSLAVRDFVKNTMANLVSERKEVFRKARADLVETHTGEGVLEPIVRFYSQKRRRR